MAVVQAGPIPGNYDMVMVDDNLPSESIQFQNFDTFYNAESENNPMSELEMMESRSVPRVMRRKVMHLRAPQALSQKEIAARAQYEIFDVARERRNQKSLVKGNSRPNTNGLEWEEFDYDAYVKH
ncbi:uncharacterized protein LOC133321124 [Musca vetustissima]|uniref:uncharacterized protein LOC133321124 n=1 Tax=Musca vetustissima TaxID=27455 RepID=UPI002AB68359|nr:uncharacterized protein LOC133321124 [Musca vetustissima]